MIKFASTKTSSVGQMALILPILRRLHLREIVDRICPPGHTRTDGITHGEVVEALVINRLMSPTPLYRVKEWATISAIDETLQIDPEKLNDFRIARTLDILVPDEKTERSNSDPDREDSTDNILEIESQLALRAITEFKLNSNIVHYDVTSIFFEGNYKDQAWITFGYSRDHRPDAKQINLGLNTVDEVAIPVAHEVYKGNTADVCTVISNMQKLKAVIKPKDLLIVSDRGTVSVKNLLAMKAAGVGFIATISLTQQHKKEISKIGDSEFKELGYLSEHSKKLKEQGNPYHKYFGKEIQLRLHENGHELDVRALIILSTQKLFKDRATRKKNLRKLIDKLTRIKESLNKWDYKDKQFVQKKLHSLFYKNRYAKFIKWRLSGKKGEVKFDFGLDKGLLRFQRRLDGKYVIISDAEPSKFDSSRLLEEYKKQGKLDWRIRNLKRRVLIRPMFLHKENRIKALVFITVIALMVYSLIEAVLKKAEVPSKLLGEQRLTAKRALDIFEKVNLVKQRLSTGETFLVLEDLTPMQEEIIKVLGVEHPRKLIAALNILGP